MFKTLLFAPALVLTPVTPATAQEAVHIAVGDIDFASPAARHKLDHRIARAAGRFCTSGYEKFDVRARKAKRACKDQVMAKAIAAAGMRLQPRLAGR